jgi:hypothetical protein
MSVLFTWGGIVGEGVYKVIMHKIDTGMTEIICADHLPVNIMKNPINMIFGAL